MRNVELVSANFELIYTNSIPAQLDSDGKVVYAPIQPLLVPIIISGSILKIHISTNIPVGSQWLSAGRINRVIDNCKIDEDKNLFIGQNLLLFDAITNDYQVLISVPKYFENLDLSIYEYIGNDTIT